MNPYIIIAVLLAFALSNASSYLYGGHIQKAQDIASAKQEQDRAIKDANDAAAKDKAQAVAQAAKDAQARTVASMLRSQANAVIKPQPVVCDWNDASFGLLVATVNAANGDTGGTSKLPDAVRRSNGPGK